MVTSSSNTINIGNMITNIGAPISPTNKRIIMGSIMPIKLVVLMCVKKMKLILQLKYKVLIVYTF